METKNEVCDALYKVDFIDTKGNRQQAVRFGKEIGTSGIFLPSYFDHRVVSQVPSSTKVIIKYMQELVKDSGGNFIISSADAGIPWGANVAFALGRGFALMRKEKYENGVYKLAGAIPEGAIVDFLDDLNTSLKTVAAGIKCTTYHGGVINSVNVDIDRQKYDPEKESVLKEHSLELKSNVTERDLIAFGQQIGKVTEEDLKLIKLAEKDYEAFTLEIIESDPDWVKGHRHAKDTFTNKKNMASSKIMAALEEVVGR